MTSWICDFIWLINCWKNGFIWKSKRCQQWWKLSWREDQQLKKIDTVWQKKHFCVQGIESYHHKSHLVTKKFVGPESKPSNVGVELGSWQAIFLSRLKFQNNLNTSELQPRSSIQSTHNKKTVCSDIAKQRIRLWSKQCLFFLGYHSKGALLVLMIIVFLFRVSILFSLRWFLLWGKMHLSYTSILRKF